MYVVFWMYSDGSGYALEFVLEHDREGLSDSLIRAGEAGGGPTRVFYIENLDSLPEEIYNNRPERG